MAIGLQTFDVVEVIGNSIQNNVSDPAKKQRWVFPTFAENDSLLPQCTVKITNTQFENNSAASYLRSELDDTIYREYYYKQAKSNVKIYIRSGKKQEFVVQNNNQELFLTSQPLNTYLASKVWEHLCVEQEFRRTFKSYFDNFKIISTDFAFEESSNVWASEILCEVLYKNLFVKEYIDGELVNEYTLISTAQYGG